MIKTPVLKTLGTILSTAMAVVILGGCETKSFIDPSEMGRYKKDPLVVTILGDLQTGIEEPNVEFTDAGEIRPEDMIASTDDYKIGKNDLVSVSITDLVGVGVESVKTARVSESGFLTLPLIGQIKAAGLTEAELEQKIVAAYRDAGLIQNAQVSVTVAEARARTFSVLGAGQYQIIQSDFRMIDAMVLVPMIASGEYAYIVRRNPPSEVESTTQQSTQPTTETEPGSDVKPDDDLLAPRTGAGPTTAPAGNPTTNVAADDVPKYVIGPDGKPMLLTGPEAATQSAMATTSPSASGSAMTPPTNDKPFEFSYLTEPTDKRVIRVPIEPLINGELKYNVVIRPNDLIVVPPPVSGEYYMGGHVARVGVYSLTGRKISLKMAVISAGMLDGIAIPTRTDIIRRIGKDKEIWVRVDLAAIFDGSQPDIFLKPNDQVMVGTNLFATFIAGIRGAFRFSYGSGYFYDINFND